MAKSLESQMLLAVVHSRRGVRLDLMRGHSLSMSVKFARGLANLLQDRSSLSKVSRKR